MNPMILCYNIQPEKLGRMRVLCLRLGIRVRVAQPAEFALPIGVLAGVADAPKNLAPAEPFDDEMLVMAHFQPGMLDAFLDGFRQSRIPSVALKAMLTPTNAAWPGHELHRAVAEEHAQMEALRKKK